MMGVRRIGAAARPQGDNRVASISFASVERAAGIPATSRGDNRERTYRSALRHSWQVRGLRVALVAVVAASLLAVVADNYLPIGGLRLPGEIGKLVIIGNKITMQQPHLTGYTIDARPYEFTATSARQDINKPDLVELKEIRAKIEMADKSIVRLWADAGIYDMKADMLTLNKNIHLVSSTGYEARLSRAVVDMGKGNVVSDTPVWVKLLDGDLNAKRLEIVDKGDEVHFTDVTLVLQSGKAPGKAEQR
jgi:lipopolysaccharide export system protein LptC